MSSDSEGASSAPEIERPAHMPILFSRDWDTQGKHYREQWAQKIIDYTNDVVYQCIPRAHEGMVRTEVIEAATVRTSDRDIELLQWDTPTSLGANSNTNATTDPWITVLLTDTIEGASIFNRIKTQSQDEQLDGRIGMLNSCDRSTGGGGFRNGDKSPEAFICANTTLHKSLRQSLYGQLGLPPLAVIYSPDVLVVSNNTITLLPDKEKFYVDVISCAPLTNPHIKDGQYDIQEQETAMRNKIQHILKVASDKGLKWLVLGAFGCECGNPPTMVARMFKQCITEKSDYLRGRGLERIIFTIHDESDSLHVIEAFEDAFADCAEAEVDKDGSLLMDYAFGEA